MYIIGNHSDFFIILIREKEEEEDEDEAVVKFCWTYTQAIALH